MSSVKSIRASALLSEMQFTASRSSGPGGQNVNKTNSKVTLRLSIRDSAILSDDQKNFIIQKLTSQITNDGAIVIASQESRSQGDNKALAIEKLDALLTKIFTRVKKRKPTKPGKSAKLKRLTNKKQHSEKKQWRQKPN